MDFIQQFLNAKLIWFIVGFLFLILEFMIPGVLVVFFGVGAWIVCILLFFIDISLNAQLTVFLLTSVISLVVLRKYIKNRVFGKKVGQSKQTDIIDDFTGQKAVADTHITPQKPGKVIFRGTEWNAESEFDIHKGAQVTIIDNDSLTLKVKPYSN
ncbi:MAG: NfeD family protein [Candidatus Latescibacteria bacterium]|nr:NfeD family protein [Candidatus Latescibacterota bacterium]